jgi:preprotein translocase subunit SecF
LEIIKPNTRIDFVGKMRIAVIFSICLIVITIISLIYHKGPNWGVEFIGGTGVHVKLASEIEPEEIRKALSGAGYPSESVQHIGLPGDNEYLIGFSPETVDFQKFPEFQGELEKMFENLKEFKGASILRIDYIGPKVGKELIGKAVLSLMFGCVGILIYLIFRFEFAFALGAVIAVVHDTVITIGAISLTDKEFTLTIVAALLTIIGYSVNDTIIIFDRIRENLRKAAQTGFKQIVNDGVNLTLSRTILTSFTVFIVLIPLFFLGGSVIHDFAFAMIVGVVVGSYSTVFIASAFVIYWRHRRGTLT